NALTLQTFVTVPGIVLGSATAILMNQQRGAGRDSLTAHTFRAGLALCAVVYLPLAAGLWLCRDPLAGLGTTDPAIHAATARFLAVVGPTYLLFGLTLLSLTVIEQTGWGVLATVLNLVYFTSIALGGGLAARSAHDSSVLYATVAILNVLGVLAVGS